MRDFWSPKITEKVIIISQTADEPVHSVARYHCMNKARAMTSILFLNNHNIVLNFTSFFGLMYWSKVLSILLWKRRKSGIQPEYLSTKEAWNTLSQQTLSNDSSVGGIRSYTKRIIQDPKPALIGNGWWMEQFIKMRIKLRQLTKLEKARKNLKSKYDVRWLRLQDK